MSENRRLISVFKDFRLQCSHSVKTMGDTKFSKTHGHEYLVRVEVFGEIDMSTGIVCLFEDITEAWGKVGAPLDYTNLDEDSAIGHMPTTEILAVYLHGQLSHLLGRRVAVRINETFEQGVYVR